MSDIMDNKPAGFNRRDFLKIGAAAPLSAALTSVALAKPVPKDAPQLFTAKPLSTVRIGYVGVGGMGSSHVRNLLKIDGVELKAVCDIIPERVERIQQWTVEAGQPKPEGYSRGPEDFRRLCERDDLDLVYTATPWEWHVPVCVAAMEAGKHAATEVAAALTVDECWQLVETSEKTKLHCVMMENCCYDQVELMVLNMVRKGLLGEIIHAEVGYLHDLREVKFDFEAKGEAVWRLAHSIKRDGNLYPTHGLGPAAQCMNINRGDQFDYMVSMSTKSLGLNLYAAEKFGKDSKYATQKYALGDVNVSLLRTKMGRSITLYHDCSSPRPYSRKNVIQGTRGIAEKWPDRVHIEGKSPAHEWEEYAKYDEYEHPLWKQLNDQSRGAGHGGMDFIEDYRLIKCLRQGIAPDMDVYDAAAWSVVTPLSEKSVANRSKTVDIPDFTRGAWKTREPLGIVEA
ncbi:MAG TPA: Gfo/Idh/MocA family oxidoreductase [bacterium]|nr:Gfo/Idh/MocA family oxidoreductase [bacterium]HPN44374.1 Gfo/Idh/MocA family oxidoreductase [bacterium]